MRKLFSFFFAAYFVLISTTTPIILSTENLWVQQAQAASSATGIDNEQTGSSTLLYRSSNHPHHHHHHRDDGMSTILLLLLILLIQLLSGNSSGLSTGSSLVPSSSDSSSLVSDPNAVAPILNVATIVPTCYPNLSIIPSPATLGGNPCGPVATPGTTTSTQSAQPAGPIAKCTTDLTPDLQTLKAPGVSAAIVKNDKVVCTAVAGFADTTKQTPVTPDTAFVWASVSKTVIGTSIMQLVEQGKLKLDDPVNTALGINVQVPSCAGKTMSFRQLMTHTAGIKDNWNVMDPLNGKNVDSTVSLENFVKGYLTPGGAYYNQTANFQSGCPGTIYDYSNIGASMVAYTVQKVSGIPYEQYVKDKIFTPLGMTNTSVKLADMNQSLLAIPNGNGTHEGIVDFPDGGMRTSPSQLGKFVLMYLNGGKYNGQQILQPASIQEMLKSQTTVSTSGLNQGLFWYSDTQNNTDLGGTFWGHTGSMTGAGSELWIDPVTKTGIMLVYNANSIAAPATIKKLIDESKKY